MIKRKRFTALALLAAAAMAASAATQTNVLQNINLQLTIYQQGATNANGRKVADQVTPYNTESLIAALGLVTDQQFPPGSKLVQSTVFSNVTVTNGSAVYSTVLSTNLALPTTDPTLIIGGGIIGFLSDAFTINGDQLIDDNTGNVITINGDVVAAGFNTNEFVTINTNAGFQTTLTPSTNSLGQVTNVAVVMQQETLPGSTESFLTNVASSIDILYGPDNTLYPVTNFLSFGTNSAEIVVENGYGLNTTNAYLTSQTGFSIQSLVINYVGPTNLTLALQGFVKQAMKMDTLYAHGTNKIVADIFGANSTWNVNGSGFAGGTFTTNPTPVGPILGGYLSNASPIVVEGAINVSFLKNLAQ